MDAPNRNWVIQNAHACLRWGGDQRSVYVNEKVSRSIMFTIYLARPMFHFVEAVYMNYATKI